MKLLFKFLVLVIVVFSNKVDAALPISVAAEHVILINAKTGKVLYEKNGYAPCFPASTTKIATAIYALHLGKNQLDKKMTASQEAIASITPQAKKQSNYRSPPYWLETDGTHIGIKKGETFSFEELIYAILVASANDASNVVAQNLSGSIPKFMEGLNQFLKEIGCKNTSYNNPHGLHHPEHATTAFDLARMAQYAMKDPLFRQAVSTVRYKCPQTNLEEERTFVQTNLLLRNGSFHYDKATGVKTGTTSAAGKNLVAAAEDKNRSLIAVISEHRGTREELYRDMIQVFETAFNEKKMRRIGLQKGEQKLTKSIKGAKTPLKTYLSEALYYDFYPSEEIKVKTKVEWDTLTLPIAKDQQVGVVKIIDDKGNAYAVRPLLSSQEIKPTLWQTLFHGKLWRQIIFYITATVFLLSIWIVRKKA